MYVSLVTGAGKLLVTEPLLVQAAVIAFLLSAVFTSFWTTLSFLLSEAPFRYSSAVIGLFGLIGVVVILAAPVYSRLVIDKMVPLMSAVLGLVVELVGVVVGTFVGSFHVAGPVIQAVAIDLGSQFTQIANRSAIYGIRPDAQNRVNTAYMVAAFSGQLTGTAVGNRLYAEGGWMYSGGCSSKFVFSPPSSITNTHSDSVSRIHWLGLDRMSRPRSERNRVDWMEGRMDNTQRRVDVKSLSAGV